MPHVPITLGQMREVDRLMIDEYCIGLVTMMENAGRGLATLARMQVGGDVAGAPIVVLVGTGNNGGAVSSPLVIWSTPAPRCASRSRLHRRSPERWLNISALHSPAWASVEAM